MEDKPRYIYFKGRRYHLNRGYYKTTVGMHQMVWEHHFGEIPKDHHIHHKNGDSTDNRIENLECIHKTKHHSMHFKATRQVMLMQTPEARLKRKEWALSQEGNKKLSDASKSQWPKRKPIERICIICEKTFLTKNLNGTKYCSSPCRGQAQWARNLVKKKCIICQKEFIGRNIKPITKTCSQECKGHLISLTKMRNFHDPFSTT